MHIEFPNLQEMKKWLVTTTGVALTSVSLIQDIQNIEIQVKSPLVLYQALENQPYFLPDGPYMVEYKELSEESNVELDYSKMAYAIAFSAIINNSRRKIGGLDELSKALSGFKVCSTLDKEKPSYITAKFWIVEPLNPQDLENLKQILANYAVVYGFNDGLGTINASNTKFGNGIHMGLS